eukprot:GHVT01073824.1.p1 GENE.GHVT01073824.1~~GHVT01073824.1.p1  ORF type:complete len:375 (-),score=80.27 GHVT01073824.1:980-2104(-)
MLRHAVRSFAEEEIKPFVREMDETEALRPEIISSLFKLGYMGMEVPAEYGGSAMSFSECLVVIEEISRVDPSVAVMLDIHNTMVIRCILNYGTQRQKNVYLPKLVEDSCSSFCLSESGSGSDAFSLKTSARRVDGGWRLKGGKQWISSASDAKLFIVFATTDPSLKHRGISAFLVEAGAAGLQVGKKIEKLGIRASPTCEVFFDDVFVGDEDVLGEMGKGYKIAIDTLNEGRIGIAAQMLGLAQGAFDVSLPYLSERVQFGGALNSFQGVRFQVAELAVAIESARLLTYNAAALKESSLPFTKQAAMAKLHAGRTAEQVASQCVEFFGGNGFSKDYPLEKFYRDAKIGSIYEGTSNIQLETIAKLVVKEFEASG